MKRNYFSLFAAASMMMAVTSCSQEEDFAPVQSGEMTTFKVNLEGAASSRAAADGMTATKLYFEVYQGTKKVVDNYGEGKTNHYAEPVTLDGGKAEIKLPLLRGEKYDIMFWAQAAEGSIYDPTDLQKIKVNYKNDADENQTLANIEKYDAFFYGQSDFQATANVTEIKLRRPFAQLNIGTTDADWQTAITMIDNTNEPVTTSEVTVTGLATEFDVLAGEATGSEDVTFRQNDLLFETFKAKVNDVENTYHYLAMNYLLVPGAATSTSGLEVKHNTDVTATFWRGEQKLFSIEKTNLANLPIQRNWRTNILGNLLADPKTLIIEIDEAFENDVNKEIEIYADGIVKENGFYHITKVEGLWAFANWVNTGYTQGEGRAATDDHTFKGQTIYLDCDIDLENKAWTPISNFQGTFDGQGNTISNLSVKVEGKASAGLFANCQGYIQNLNVNNAEIKGHYRAGVIVGNGLCSRIEKCHVDGATVTITPLDNDDANHAGGIVGYLSAENEAYVKDCSVKNATIIAYRDAGGIAGTATTNKTNPVVSGNTVENVTVIADQTNEYKEVKVANVDAIVGRRHQNAIIENNTIGEGVEIYVKVNTAENAQFQAENATGDILIKFGADIEGDVMIQQKPEVAITIDGEKFKYSGVICVDGKSSAYATAGLTIKNLNFAAETISADACIRLGNGNDATRYTSNVTVENCTFDVPGAVAIKSYTGGDKNLTITGCTATDKAHSLVQVANIEGEGIIVKDCIINSKNGMNFNNTAYVLIDHCTADVKGYVARFGQGNASGAEETYFIKNSTLKSACEEAGDAVIVLRGSADKSTLTIENTTLEGAPNFANNAVDAKIIIDGKTIISSLSEIQAMIDNGETEITLDADFIGTLVMKSNVTINGNGNLLGSVNLNGANNVTLNNIKFDAAKAVMGYDKKGTGRQYANIITGDQTNNSNKGAWNLVIDGCTFGGTFVKAGASICFADRNRNSGASGNITIKNCTFDTKGGNYDIYGYYTGNGMNGYGDFVIESNTFKSVRTQGYPVFLNQYRSNTSVVVKENAFETVATIEDAVHLGAASNYTVSYNATDNTFAE